MYLKDNLIMKAKEGYGILSDCLKVLGVELPLEILEKITDWALEALKSSNLWDTRFWAVYLLETVLEVPLENGNDMLKSKEKNILKILMSAKTDRNRQVKQKAEHVLDKFKKLSAKYSRYSFFNQLKLNYLCYIYICPILLHINIILDILNLEHQK